MYLPEHFKEESPERIQALIQENAFGMLVTAPQGQPFVSHLPFLFEPSSGAQGKLFGHMARANPHWEHLASCDEVLVVFQGAHAYVSPSWYAAPGVPTWNYAVVHLRGKPRIMGSEAELEALLERQTDVYEQKQPKPWKPDLAGERRTKLLGMIVGFEIEITDIQAKFKLSQNRSAEDRLRVIEELESSKNSMEASVAKLMGA
ncbi:FMN-binding negative transcriptional regulator [Thiobacillus sp.]|uniref:FMN-binding negative transcriptional regulator n=1 Tax=Thiobacillus sp. TaxID=924 RepID=UPI0025CDF1AD|nr:FMN-binding negative transcriptional regulator [Thiobacillus sp.]MBT9540345.1 FMN-binding negative transcriptional regulator [Thiobacillus sp.]